MCSLIYGVKLQSVSNLTSVMVTKMGKLPLSVGSTDITIQFPEIMQPYLKTVAGIIRTRKCFSIHVVTCTFFLAPVRFFTFSKNSQKCAFCGFSVTPPCCTFSLIQLEFAVLVSLLLFSLLKVLIPVNFNSIF